MKTKPKEIDANAIRAKLRALIKELGLGQNAMARRMGVSNSHLSRVLSGEKDPGDKIAGRLGYECVTRYRLTDYAFTPDNRSA